MTDKEKIQAIKWLLLSHCGDKKSLIEAIGRVLKNNDWKS